MSKPRPFSVYALLDPRDDPPSIRYIGCTKVNVDSRVSMHMSAAVGETSNAPKDEWIRELIRENLEPLFTVLERVYGDVWQEREQHWIAKYAGPLLLNVATGGVGSPGAARSKRTRQQIGDAFRGVPLSEEHRQKIASAKLGHEVTQAVRSKIARSLTGRVQSEATKQRRRETLASVAYKHSEEVRAKISAAKRGVTRGPLPEETKAKLSAVMGALVWITDGHADRRIPKTAPIPEGWNAGRSIHPSKDTP